MTDGVATRSRVSEAIDRADGPAICAYVTAGYPDLETFPAILDSVADAADVVEVGVPFTDPMADGHTIQRASRAALDAGVSLRWILELLSEHGPGLKAPYLLMGYYNPFLAHGLDALGPSLESAGASGLIVPDLPYEESGPLRAALDPHGIGLVQLVTPSTPEGRLQRLAAASECFVYAVTVKGVTGGQVGLADNDLGYLRRVKGVSHLPVLAGFGIRTSDDVAALGAEVDGVVVGSALLEAIDRGEDPGAFIGSLRLAGAKR